MVTAIHNRVVLSFVITALIRNLIGGVMRILQTVEVLCARFWTIEGVSAPGGKVDFALLFFLVFLPCANHLQIQDSNRAQENLAKQYHYDHFYLAHKHAFSKLAFVADGKDRRGTRLRFRSVYRRQLLRQWIEGRKWSSISRVVFRNLLLQEPSKAMVQRWVQIRNGEFSIPGASSHMVFLVAVLGNHDYRGDVKAQLDPILRRIDRRWFCLRSFVLNAGGLVTFIFLFSSLRKNDFP